MLRYFPRLNVFKGSNNCFDGRVALSYGWYVYARRLVDGTYVMVENNYSQTTSKHKNDFHRLVGWDSTFRYVLAPGGLGDLDGAKLAIKAEIKKLQTELRSPRIRDRDSRNARIANLREQLRTIAMIRRDQKKAAKLPIDMSDIVEKYSMKVRQNQAAKIDVSYPNVIQLYK